MDKGFYFHEEWFDAMTGLSRMDRLGLYEAVIEYGLKGTVKTLSPLQEVIFKLIRNEIDSYNEKELLHRKRISAVRSKSGKLGGRPKKGKQNKAKKANVLLGFKDEESENLNACLSGICTDKDESYQLPPPNNKNKYIYNLYNLFFENGRKGDVEKLSLNVIKRIKEFSYSLLPYVDKYSEELITNFFGYWSELNRSKTKMLCELKPTWDLSRRLSFWKRNADNKDFKYRLQNEKNGNDIKFSPKKPHPASNHESSDF